MACPKTFLGTPVCHSGTNYLRNSVLFFRKFLRFVQPGCTVKLFPIFPCHLHYLTGKETEPWEIIYFKLYKSQLPVVEQALETVALMLGSDKARGYCLEMICADFLAGSGTQENQFEVLVLSLERLYKTLPDERRDQLCNRIKEGPWEDCAKSDRGSS